VGNGAAGGAIATIYLYPINEQAAFSMCVHVFAHMEFTEMRSYSIEEWCQMHSLSRAFFYKLASQGRAPESFKVGRITRITDEANREWIAARKATSQAVA
jgi:predicted DNA-binding transcriptional regulator AlpA